MKAILADGPLRSEVVNVKQKVTDFVHVEDLYVEICGKPHLAESQEYRYRDTGRKNELGHRIFTWTGPVNL